MASGIAVSYLTLRPRADRAPVPASEITMAGEIEAIGESLGEFVIPDDLMVPANGLGEPGRPGRTAVS